MKKIWIPALAMFFTWQASLTAQEHVTNAFDDLKRTGTVNEQQSEMRQPASEEALAKLMGNPPAAGYFCFAEDRLHDIRLTENIPARWTTRPLAEWQKLEAACAPGEFYVWQIGVFAPFHTLNNITATISDLRNGAGDKIPSSAFQCFNLSGINTKGEAFQKQVKVEKGKVQALWMGMDIPASAQGVYKGVVTISDENGKETEIEVALSVEGTPIANHGDDEGWRKSRLRWLNSSIGNAETPTRPYVPVQIERKKGYRFSWLGGNMDLGANGLPSQITTKYTANNALCDTLSNPVLADAMRFIIETPEGIEPLGKASIHIEKKTDAHIVWTARQKSADFEVECTGNFGFDGITNLELEVKARRDKQVKDIRLEVPYTAFASKYMMGLGHKGGFRPDSVIKWTWNVEKHQDKIWMGNVNAGMNLRFMDEHFVRPLVNIYYALGRLNLPVSWGNDGKGGIDIFPAKESTRLVAYSGERKMKKGDVLHYLFDMQITPVKPLDLEKQATERFYHSNSDLSASYIPEAEKAGANLINVHHKKDIYPFINYPYYDESTPDLKRFIEQAHAKGIGVRLYYTTRELTVKVPELWALRSLGTEVIHEGPGKDTRTLIHPNGPNEWLNQNLTTHFIPAWYNAFREGKYAGDMDISVITTPDSRWNNYYLEGLHWMVKNLGIDGIYIDDSALDRQTLQRARRILDKDGKRRTIDIHSWNHMNQWAGYANSLHIYTELLPYVDRTWIGEGFREDNTMDFWLVEMSGIPFGLLSETLDAKNRFRGMIYGMLPRLPWSGNPVPLWEVWDTFGMKDAEMHGYWDPQCPVKTDNPDIPATVYTNGKRALVVLANWTDLPQRARITIDEKALGFRPTKYTLPQIEDLQWGKTLRDFKTCELMGRDGIILLIE